MENFGAFIHFLNKFVPLSNEEFSLYIEPYVEVRQFRKKQLLSRQGEVDDYVNFIQRGLVRKFFIRQQEEINLMICSEGHLVNDFESFYNRTPGEYSVEAIEPTTVFSISHANLERIYASNARMEKIGRKVVSHAMILKERWQLHMAKLTPRERFLEFVKKRPELLQRVPQKYLASFLNIQPETFSRFKHLLKERI